MKERRCAVTRTAVSPPVRLVALAVAVGLSVGGCNFLDGKPPVAMLDNARDSPVTLVLTGVNVPPKEFPAHQGRTIWGGDGTPIEGRGACEGDGFVLTDTATGTVLATSTEPVCADTRIKVSEDGTVSW